MVSGIIFDLDGVLVDSEQWWDEIRRAVVAEYGGAWRDGATTAMLGMSTPEWAAYLVTELGAGLTAERAAAEVVARMARRYEGGPPLLPGAVAAVTDAARRAPVGIASSSPQVIIAAFLDATGLAGTVRAAVSSETVRAGKPDPAVYLAAAERLGVAAGGCVAIEDSTNGIRAALAAGMTTVAAPNPHFPPDPAVLARARHRIGALAELPAVLDGLA
jgi:HAD superfamily hydrolase (TIGR01509 family)